MVRIDVVYEGELHTACLHAPSGAAVATDAPRDNHGRGESFSPTDLLATALGSCTLTVMGIHAQREGHTLDGARVRVEKHMTVEPTRRVGRLVAHFDMPKGIPVEARASLEQAALTCPVKESIHPDIATEFEFRWHD
jgi:putative redox protein